jgi:hypothetical protein
VDRSIVIVNVGYHGDGPNRAPGFLGHVARLVHGLSTTEQRQVSPFQGTAGQALGFRYQSLQKNILSVRPTVWLTAVLEGCGKIGMVPCYRRRMMLPAQMGNIPNSRTGVPIIGRLPSQFVHISIFGFLLFTMKFPARTARGEPYLDR